MPAQGAALWVLEQFYDGGIMSTKDRAKAKAYEAKSKAYETKANLEDAVDEVADSLPDEVTSRKGWLATMLILTVIGLVVWLVLNSSDEA
jgi:hypothetical protein